MVDTYAVMGHPVAHSKSPFIHEQFAKQTHQAMQYLKIDVPEDKFLEYLTLFAFENGKGLNITAPFKQQAFSLMSEITDRAHIAKSVNTIKIMQDGRLFGDNTDGVGFIADLTNQHHFSLKEKSILILGAGGAARGLLYPILSQVPRCIMLANRTLLTAQNLADDYRPYGNILVSGLTNISGTYDLIINATSMIQQEVFTLNPSALTRNTFCYDLMYGQEPTPFLKWAVSNGATKISDGLGMLVEQAAESFFIWRGVKPETKYVIEKLKNPSVG